jgi:hypothetical protein
LHSGSAGAELAYLELQAMIARLTAAGKKVYLLAQSPNDDSLDPRRLIGARWGRASFAIKAPAIDREVLERPAQVIAARLRGIADVSGARLIDPFDYLCAVRCPVVTKDGLPIYRDEGHLNPGFVRSNVTYLDGIVLFAEAGSSSSARLSPPSYVRRY